MAVTIERNKAAASASGSYDGLRSWLEQVERMGDLRYVHGANVEEAQKLYVPVISPDTSMKIRYLMRLNALEGSGSRMNKIATGYRTGGKTGTAEKVVGKSYSSDKTLSVFASAFPLDNPRYAMVILIDEPQRENPQSGTTAGWNAGEMTGRIVQRVAPMLGIAPDFSEMLDQNLVPAELR